MVTSAAQVGQGGGELASDGAAADHHGGAGTRGISKNSSEVTTKRPSGSNPGIVLGTDPGARMTASPVRVARSPSAPTTSTVRSGPRVPVPLRMVTLRSRQQRLHAARELVDDLLLALRGSSASRVTRAAPPPRSRRHAARYARPTRSPGAPWPGCSPGAGTCRRSCPARRGRCSGPPRPRRGRRRTRPGPPPMTTTSYWWSVTVPSLPSDAPVPAGSAPGPAGLQQASAGAAGRSEDLLRPGWRRPPPGPGRR